MRRLGWVLGGAWLVAVAGGFAGLMAYERAPGAQAAPPPAWPAASALPRAAGAPVLLVFAHPRCPCSRATLGEVEAALARAPGAARLVVALWRPGDADDAWVEGPLARAARALPGALVVADPEGVEARRFGAATSGHVALYGRDGRARWWGGLTAGRGQAGETAARRALVAHLHGLAPASPVGPSADPARPAFASVFGCPLADPPEARHPARPVAPPALEAP